MRTHEDTNGTDRQQWKLQVKPGQLKAHEKQPPAPDPVVSRVIVVDVSTAKKTPQSADTGADTDTDSEDGVRRLRGAFLLPATLAVAAVCVDCLEAFATFNPFLSDTPSSLRTSSLALIICIASPPVRESWKSMQLALLLVLLFVSAMLGTHEAGPNMRAFEVFFVIAASIPIVAVVLTGTLLSQDSATSWGRETPSAVIYFAFVAYSGMRSLRHGLFMCSDVDTYSTTIIILGDGRVVAADGCSMCNSMAAAAIAASGAAMLVSSSLILYRTTGADHLDTTRTLIPLVGAACIEGIATLCAFVALANTKTSLPSLFGDDACVNTPACDAARALRRFNTVSHCTAAMTVNFTANLMLVASLSSIKNSLARSADVRAIASVLLGIGSLYGFVVVLWYSDISDIYSYTDVATLVAVFGVVIGGIFDSVVGGQIILTGVAFEIISHIWVNAASWRTMLTYFTIVSNVLLLLLYLCLVLLDLVAAARRFGGATPPPGTVESGGPGLVENAMSVLATAGRSISFYLLLGSTALIAIYDGGAIPYRNGVYSAQRTVFAFLLVHFVPFVAWSFLSVGYARLKTRRACVITWIASLAVVFIVYGVCVGSSGSLGIPDEYPTSHPSITIAVFIGVVIIPWYAAIG